MTPVGDLDYAQARLAARFGERPDEVAWRLIEVIRGLPALLEAARGLPLQQWLAGITPDAGPHAIEAALVFRWRALVAEVTSWMPPAWQAAVEWAGALADLPVVQYLARGGEALPWMRADAVYRELCGEISAPLAAGPLAPLAAAWSHPDRLLRAWRDEWARRLPHGAFVDTPIIDDCARALHANRAAAADATLTDGTALRRALAARLTLLFRRATLDPAAAFIFLALSALDLERLRGELLRRAIFPRFGPAA
jgi:hypothetical protein